MSNSGTERQHSGEATAIGSGASNDGDRTRRALIGLGSLAAAIALVVGLLMAFTGGDGDTATCAIAIEPGARYDGASRNDTGGFDGRATLEVMTVDLAACTVTVDVEWSDGLSGRGEDLTGTIDDAGSGQLTGTFLWDDGDYDLLISATALTNDVAQGTYDITARQAGPTVAVGVGTFDTVRIDVPDS